MSVTFKKSRLGGHITAIDRWSSRNGSSSFDEFEYIDIASVDRETKAIVGTTRTSAADAPSRARQIVRANDVVVSTVRPNLNAVAVVPEELCGAIASTGLCVLRSHPDRMCHRYLYHWVRTPYFMADMVRKATGASYPAVSDTIIKDSLIPLPPLSEQKRISDILDRADAILRKRQELTSSTRELMQSIFDEMFGPPITNPHDWPVKPLDQVIAQGTSVSYGIVQCGAEFERGVPYVRTSDMSSEQLGPIGSFSRTSPEIASKFTRSTVRTGDLIFANRATIGAVVEVPDYLDGANLTQGTTRIAPGPSTHRHYLLWLIRAPQMQRWLDRAAKGVTFREITMGRLREMPIPIPPHEVQEEFSKKYEGVRKLSSDWDIASRKASALFNSLVQHAFKGEL